MRKIPLIKPYVDEAVKQRVLDVLDSGYLTEGPVTRQFQQAVAEYVGAKHALAVTSCTTGLEIALRALGVGPGDEVIIPDFTYPATGSAVCIAGADVVIVDVDPSTMLMDFDALETAISPRTKAVIPVSLFGNPLDFDRLDGLKREYGFSILEDAACSLGAAYHGRRVGGLADISVFSLHPRKFITTGEGGVITTNDDDLAAFMDSFKHFGMAKGGSGRNVSFVRTGTNAKLSNLQAAVGLAQMDKVDKLLADRVRLAERYRELLAGASLVELAETTPHGDHSYQSFCVFVDERDRIISEMAEAGVETQIGTFSLHREPAFRDDPHCRLVGDMAGSLSALMRCLVLPLFYDMTDDEQRFVVDSLLRATMRTANGRAAA